MAEAESKDVERERASVKRSNDETFETEDEQKGPEIENPSIDEGEEA